MLVGMSGSRMLFSRPAGRGRLAWFLWRPNFPDRRAAAPPRLRTLPDGSSGV